MHESSILLKEFLVNCGSPHDHITRSLTSISRGLIAEAFLLTIKDANYHHPGQKPQQVLDRIITNNNELCVFLYRTARLIYLQDPLSEILNAIHFIMRSMCACEIYYSTAIDEGFCVIHGLGTVIGSRHVIGKGFKIHQGCTIGHATIGGPGCRIGDNVTLYANASVIGECNIGSNVTINAYSLVLTDVPSDTVCRGIPAQIFSKH